VPTGTAQFPQLPSRAHRRPIFGHGRLVSAAMTLIVLLILGAGIYSYLDTQVRSVSIASVNIDNYGPCGSGLDLGITLEFEKPAYVTVTGGSLSLTAEGRTIGSGSIDPSDSSQASVRLCTDLTGIPSPAVDDMSAGRYDYQIDGVVEASAVIVSASVPFTYPTP